MITTILKHRIGDDPDAVAVYKLLHARAPRLQSVRLERVLRIEGPTEVAARRLQAFFADPVVETVTDGTVLRLEDGPIIEVAYKRSMTDPELDALLVAAEALGVSGVVWARWAIRYQLCGVSEETAAVLVSRHLLNDQTQQILPAGFAYDTLVPQGKVGDVEIIDVREMTDAELHALSTERRLLFPAEQLPAVREMFQTLGRAAYDAELEVVAARWSDHCDHSTWRSMHLLQGLKAATRRIASPLVLGAYDDNSGVMRFYGRYALCVKVESHISPAYVGFVYGGIMTMHGGVIRDILGTGKGAYPICATLVMATCDPRLDWALVVPGGTHPGIVVKGSILGTSDYTNPMGIPMAASQFLVHSRNWKGMALGGCVGVMPQSAAKKGQPRPGDLVLLIGGLTGNDGMHGATVSSRSATATTATADAAHVQIGMPIEERAFMDAIPALRDAGCIRAITDCGAAGLSSACLEMGEKIGVWLNLAWVPLKCLSMLPWQILLSESQERMVAAVPPGKLRKAMSILKTYGVRAAVIGVFSGSKKAQAIFDPELSVATWLAQGSAAELSGQVAVDLPYSLIDEHPLPVIAVADHLEKPPAFTPAMPEGEAAWLATVQKHLGHYNTCDQSAATHRFDQTVGGRTVLPLMGRRHSGEEDVPNDLAVYRPIHGKPWGAGVAEVTNQYYSEVDPVGQGRLVLAHAGARLVAAGFHPDDITMTANVTSPPVRDRPDHALRLQQLVRDGYGPASVELGWPIISGKDSSNCRLGEIDAPLGFSVLALGRMRNVAHLIPKAAVKPGDTLVLYHPGLISIGLGGSTFLDTFGERGDALSELDLVQVRQGLLAYARMLAATRKQQFVHAASAVGEGGLMRRLFELSLTSGFGCEINLSDQPLEWLFGELAASVLVAVDPAMSWCDYLDEASCLVLGQVTTGSAIAVSHRGVPLFSSTPVELSTQWAKNFAEVAQ